MSIIICSLISEAHVKDKPTYLCGDFNINLLNYQNHFPTNHFIDMLNSLSFYPLITHPTRITASSATLIDNIFTNVLHKQITNGILISDLSDHLPVFSLTSDLIVKDNAKMINYSRNYSPQNVEKFVKL